MTARGPLPPTGAHLAVETAPAEATELFGAEFVRAERYVGLLATAGVERGLLGPREPARLWTRHVLNSAALRSLLPMGAEVVDIGSGAGLPGIPLALARPDLRVTLVEPMARRVAFLEYVSSELDLDVRIRRCRAEELAADSVDAVVVRAVAPLDRLVLLTMRLLRPGGRCLALKGDNAAAEITAARRVLEHWAGARVSLERLPMGTTTATVIVMDRDNPGSRAEEPQP